MVNYQKVLNKYTKYLMRKRGVTSVGWGFKVKDGERTNMPSIVVGVENKKPIKYLGRWDRIPKRVMGLQTDVVETGLIHAGGVSPLDETGRFRPSLGGVSIGHPNITAGTFGVLLRDAENRPVILSNNHVLAASNNASIGDQIIQPGAFDGGTVPNDVIATLQDYVEIKFGGSSGNPGLPDFLRQLLCLLFGLFCDNPGGGGDNTVDAAIALPTDEEFVVDGIMDIGDVQGIVDPALGTTVQKQGRTTEYTTSTIQQIGATVNVNYGEGRQATFVNQIITGAMSEGGDSGSVVLDMDNNLVGLLFAGSPELTVLNPINDVMNLLDLRLPLE